MSSRSEPVAAQVPGATGRVCTPGAVPPSRPPAGNVIAATGSNFTVIKFDGASGAERWRQMGFQERAAEYGTYEIFQQ
jgi:hypothetical protein